MKSRSVHWPNATGMSCGCTVTACSGPLRTLRTWSRRHSFERGGIEGTLKVVPPNAPGCTASRPTRVWMRFTAGRAGCFRQRLCRRPLSDLPFLQPYPDQLLDEVVEKETIELTFIAAIQYLPPRQRAVLILRDVLDWSANETASLLDLTVAAVKSALQRARSTLRQRLPKRRIDWSRSAQSVEQDRAMLQRYMQALERLDVSGLAQLLSEDARMAMPPLAWWYAGREAIVTYSRNSWSVVSPENIRLLATSANRQPAVAYYVRELVRQPGEAEYRCVALIVLRVEGSEIVEITTFLPSALPWLVQAFGLPATL